MTLLRRLFGTGERRKYRRLKTGEVRFTVGEVELWPVDWSPGGFRGGGLPETPERGSFISGTVEVGRKVKGPFTACVISVYEDGSVGARFDEIDADVFRALASLR